MIATLKPLRGSLGDRSPGIWQVPVSLGRDPKTKRYTYFSSTVHGDRRAAQRKSARLVKLASEGQIPLERETLGGLLARWLTASRLGPGRSRPCSALVRLDLASGVSSRRCESSHRLSRRPSQIYWRDMATRISSWGSTR